VGVQALPHQLNLVLNEIRVTEYITIEKESIVYQPKIKYITKVDIDTF
jgi:hypothetical protein